MVQCNTEGLKQLIQLSHPERRAAQHMAALQTYDLEIKTLKGTRASHASLLLDLGDPPEDKFGALSDELETKNLAWHTSINLKS